MSIADAQNICNNPRSNAKHHLLLREDALLTRNLAISVPVRDSFSPRVSLEALGLLVCAPPQAYAAGALVHCSVFSLLSVQKVFGLSCHSSFQL